MDKKFLKLVKKLTKEEEVKTINKYKLTNCNKLRNVLIEHYVKNVRGAIGSRLKKGLPSEFKEEMELCLIESLFSIVPRLKNVETLAANSYIDVSLNRTLSRCLLKADLIERKRRSKHETKETKELKTQRYFFVELEEENHPLFYCSCFTSAVKEKAIEFLDKFLNTLSADYRSVFCFRSGYPATNIFSCHEISKILGVSVWSAESYSRKIRSKLAKMYS